MAKDKSTMMQDAKDSIDRLTQHIEKLMEISQRTYVPQPVNQRTEAFYKQNKK